MNAASAGPVASIIFPTGLCNTCVSFKSDLLVACVCMCVFVCPCKCVYAYMTGSENSICVIRKCVRYVVGNQVVFYELVVAGMEPDVGSGNFEHFIV